MQMTWEKTKEYIRRDLYRNLESCAKKDVLKALCSGKSMMGVLIYYRLCRYFVGLQKRNVMQFLLHSFCYIRFRHLQERCGIELSQRTEIGYGLRLPHKGGIIIHVKAIIGNNCEIMQGVTIGNNIMKSRDEVAVIGDEVLLCSGAKVIGKVKIGNTVIVGANAVVTHDIEDHTIVGGIPARPIGKCDDRFVINKKKQEWRSQDA